MPGTDGRQEQDAARADKDDARARKDEAREARADARETTQADKHDRFREFTGSIVRWSGAGGGVGGLAGLLTVPADPSMRSAMVITMGSAMAGVLGSFGAQFVATYKAKGLAAAEIRRAWIEAESDANYQARLAAERQLEQCQAEKERMQGRLDDVEATCRRLEEKIDRFDGEHRAERALGNARYDDLHAEYAALVAKTLNTDGQKAGS